jgi:indole-3-glycerol phosphate synthase
MKTLIKEIVLGKIVDQVALRIAEKKGQLSEAALERICESLPPSHGGFAHRSFESLFRTERAGSRPDYSIIAEIKFISPSEGILNSRALFSPEEIAKLYLSNGATAVSVLTERDFFGGDISHLQAVRMAIPSAPLLMKDFVMERYQLLEARASGADCVLLIAGLLEETTLRNLIETARSLGLSALVEVHDEDEMDIAAAAGATLIGVNNRDLKSLKVSLNTSERLITRAPKSAVLISESGIRGGAELNHLRAMGYRGFLIGTTFMRTDAPGLALQSLLSEARSLC